MSISEFNILDWSYQTGDNETETGIMLVESIQNFKTYFSNIKFDCSFNLNVDFSRLSCSDPVCPVNNASYPANFTLQKMSMAIS